MTCLFCGEPTPRAGCFHVKCDDIYKTCVRRKRSSHWSLLEALAERDGVGIADTFAVLDDWERVGIVERDEARPKYRMLTERGMELYQYLRKCRNKRFAGAV